MQEELTPVIRDLAPQCLHRSPVPVADDGARLVHRMALLQHPEEHIQVTPTARRSADVECGVEGYAPEQRAAEGHVRPGAVVPGGA